VSLSGRGRRQKGVRGEREVAGIFKEYGLELRNLERTGDQLVWLPRQERWLHCEVKRQEALRMTLWNEQAAQEAPSEAVPLVAYRRSGELWYASARLDHVLELINGR
jgi:hypothetical protein